VRDLGQSLSFAKKEEKNMELKDHLEALMVLTIQEEMSLISEETKKEITDANSSGDFKNIVFGLVETVKFYLDFDGALPVVRAFVDHMLAECPGAHAPFTEALEKLDPSLVDSLLK
jgi:hypothetical protein